MNGKFFLNILKACKLQEYKMFGYSQTYKQTYTKQWTSHILR